MLSPLQTNLPHLVGFLWLIVNLHVPQVPELGVVLTLQYCRNTVSSGGQRADTSFPM